MFIETVSLENFRNYKKSIVSLGKGLNVVLGENGHGKTNFLESIYFLLTSQALRHAKEKDLIAWQASPIRLYMSFYKDEATKKHTIKYATDGQKKYLALNEVSYHYRHEFPFLPTCVSFLPDDLEIIKGSPDKRRQFLDKELSILSLSYDSSRKKYQKVLYQRNDMLKKIAKKQASESDLMPWDMALSEYGAKLIAERLAFLAVLVPFARKIHHYVARNDRYFDITYQSSFGTLTHFDEEGIKAIFLEALKNNQAEEIRRGTTLLGAHRDELVFYENKVDLRYFGSQGQQRSAVLALKLALVSYIEKTFGERPILLLDDVMSELDKKRQERLMMIIQKKKIQTILTSATIDFNLDKLDEIKRFYVVEGKINQIAN